MRFTKWLLLAVATCLPCTACAPVGEPYPEDATEVESPAAAVELMPAPTAKLPDGLRQRVEAAIEVVEQREILISNSFWTVVHGILGIGPKLTLLDPEAGRSVNAIEYICQGGPIRGMRFIPTEYGLDVQNGPMFVGQGHVDQFVAEMVQVDMPMDQKFIVDGREYTFLDFIHQAQSRVRVTTDQELSWSIVAIGHCLGTEITWSNHFGESLSFQDLIRYELDQDVEQAACGGTHRLLGLAWAYRLHRGSGGQDIGIWKEVRDKMTKYQSLAKELQNPDGSFSTESFRGTGNASDMQQRISTTGHTLEWLSISLTDAQMQEPWVQHAASALALMILESRDSPMEGGTLYHAVHALRLYAAR